MKILVPISSCDETEKLIAAGAGQLYCGVLTSSWKDTYTNIASPNKREYQRANLASFKELKEIIKRASSFGVGVVLTLNVFYSKKQQPKILEYVKEAIDQGIEGLLVADLSLIKLLAKERINTRLYMSTAATPFNSQTVNFYRLLGIKRVVLERHLSLKEIHTIVTNNPAMDFELFVLNAGSKNVDGYCAFAHGISEFKTKNPEKVFESAACYLNYDIKMTGLYSKKLKKSLSCAIKTSFNLKFCGKKPCAACFLPQFKKWGIDTIKIAGRDFPTEVKIKDAQFIKNLVVYMQTCLSNEAFSGYAKELFTKTYGFDCNQFCYYAA